MAEQEQECVVPHSHSGRTTSFFNFDPNGWRAKDFPWWGVQVAVEAYAGQEGQAASEGAAVP